MRKLGIALFAGTLGLIGALSLSSLGKRGFLLTHAEPDGFYNMSLKTTNTEVEIGEYDSVHQTYDLALTTTTPTGSPFASVDSYISSYGTSTFVTGENDRLLDAKVGVYDVPYLAFWIQFHFFEKALLDDEASYVQVSYGSEYQYSKKIYFVETGGSNDYEAYVSASALMLKVGEYVAVEWIFLEYLCE